MNNTFDIPIIPENEEERLLKLYAYEQFDKAGEGTFRYVASMATHIFQVPIALVSFVGKEHVWFKANIGMEGTDRVNRGTSLCSLAILDKYGVVFKDAIHEPCLLANPLVAGEFGLRFYAAAPLVTPDGYNIGAVCIVDKAPRKFSSSDQQLLQNLAEIVMEDLEAALQQKAI